MMMMMMLMMINCFCKMVDQLKAFSLISSKDHCQRFLPSQISDMPQAGVEPAQNQSSGLVEWSFVSRSFKIDGIIDFIYITIATGRVQHHSLGRFDLSVQL